MSRRCRTWAGLLSLSLVACSNGDGAVVPDSGAPPDWADGRFPPLLDGCGDAIVDPGESCDDGRGAADGRCVECRRVSQCGNGAVESGEDCDDANQRGGDGCRADCIVERCGDGIVDRPAEACDGPHCPACESPTGCGDGVLGHAEECDDGNVTPFDGCDPGCKRERWYVMTDLRLLTDANAGCDLSGSGRVENVVGQALASIAPIINAEVARNIRGRDEAMAVVLPDWPLGASVPEQFSFALATARHASRESREIRIEEVLPSIVLAPFADGMTSQHVAFPVAPGLLTMRSLELGRARVVASVRPGQSSEGRLELTVCGAMPIRDLALEPNRFAGAPPCADVGRSSSFADLIAGGHSFLVAATQPDIDVDGDGLAWVEVISEAQDACTPIVGACLRGDGTRDEAADCMLREPDGYSAAVQLTLERVSVVVGDGV